MHLRHPVPQYMDAMRRRRPRQVSNGFYETRSGFVISFGFSPTQKKRRKKEGKEKKRTDWKTMGSNFPLGLDSVCTFVCVCSCVCACVCVRGCACVHVCTCACVCICVYVHMCVRTWKIRSEQHRLSSSFYHHVLATSQHAFRNYIFSSFKTIRMFTCSPSASTSTSPPSTSHPSRLLTFSTVCLWSGSCAI